MRDRASRNHRGLTFGAILLGCTALLAACQTGPVYRERGPGDAFGYTDMRLTENRYRVTFRGTNATTREEVEDFLLRRAAEVTLNSGYSHFVFDARDTNAETYYRNNFGPRTRLGIGFGHFGPSPWYYSSFMFGDPFYSDARPVTRFEAYSEIVMLQTGQAADDPYAVDARQVLEALTPPPPPPPQA